MWYISQKEESRQGVDIRLIGKCPLCLVPSGITVDGSILRVKSLKIDAPMGLRTFQIRTVGSLTSSNVTAWYFRNSPGRWPLWTPTLRTSGSRGFRRCWRGTRLGTSIMQMKWASFSSACLTEHWHWKERPAVEEKNAKERLTVLLCTNSDGSDKRVSIVIGKFAKPQCSKNIQKLPVTYYANSKEWMTSEIFKDFLRTLNASFGALGRKILLFVDNCAAHSPDTSSLRNVKVVFTPLTAPVSYSLLCWM